LAKIIRALVVADSSLAGEASRPSSSTPGSVSVVAGVSVPGYNKSGLFLHAKLRQLRDQLFNRIPARVRDVFLDCVGGELLGLVDLAFVRFRFAYPIERRDDSRVIRFVFDEATEKFAHLVPGALFLQKLARGKSE